jgi:hypothetical protein
MKIKFFGIEIDFKRTQPAAPEVKAPVVTPSNRYDAEEIKSLKEQWNEIDNKTPKAKKAPTAAKAPEVKKAPTSAKEKPIRKNARFGGSAEQEQKIIARVRKMYLQDKLSYADIVKYTHTSTAFVSSCIKPDEKRGRGRKDKGEAYADRFIQKMKDQGIDT